MLIHPDPPEVSVAAQINTVIYAAYSTAKGVIFFMRSFRASGNARGEARWETGDVMMRSVRGMTKSAVVSERCDAAANVRRASEAFAMAKIQYYLAKKRSITHIDMRT